MIYLIGWIFIFFGLILQEYGDYRDRFLPYSALIFFSCIAFFRGNVGTDTASYESLLQTFIDITYEWDGIEPGFVVLGWLFVSVLPTVAVAVRAVSLVFFALIVIFTMRSNRNEQFILMAYILPAYAYQYSMNGLRIGLASAIFLLFVQQIRLRSMNSAFKMALAALSFHYSILMVIMYWFISQRPRMRLSSVVSVSMLLLMIFIAMIRVDYVASKIDAYQNFRSPGELSGLSHILVISIILTGLLFGKLPIFERLNLFFLGVLFTILGWIITQYSYAGLRILGLVTFVVPLSILASYSRLHLKFDNTFKLILVVAGVFSSIFTYRAFLLSYNDGTATPFLPYEFGVW